MDHTQNIINHQLNSNETQEPISNYKLINSIANNQVSIMFLKNVHTFLDGCLLFISMSTIPNEFKICEKFIGIFTFLNFS